MDVHVQPLRLPSRLTTEANQSRSIFLLQTQSTGLIRIGFSSRGVRSDRDDSVGLIIGR